MSWLSRDITNAHWNLSVLHFFIMLRQKICNIDFFVLLAWIIYKQSTVITLKNPQIGIGCWNKWQSSWPFSQGLEYHSPEVNEGQGIHRSWCQSQHLATMGKSTYKQTYWPNTINFHKLSWNIICQCVGRRTNTEQHVQLITNISWSMHKKCSLLKCTSQACVFLYKLYVLLPFKGKQKDTKN